jgi:catechol 2,3-dioxygenase-like lactoylglutathione lyase family enzyme
MTEPKTQPAARLLKVSPEFIVPDVVAAAEYYRDTLGFEILDYFLDPPVYAMVERDSVVIHFGKAAPGNAPSPNNSRRPGLGLDAYIWVNDLDALFAELKGRNAKIIDGPVMRVYKCYEMVVEDNYGFRLAFSMDTSTATT